MEACEGGTVLVKLNLQPGAGTSTAELRHDPVLRQALVEEFCGRCVEGAGARPTPTTKALLASFFPGLSQDSHDLIKPLNGSLLVSADVACPVVTAAVASDQIKAVRTVAPYAAFAANTRQVSTNASPSNSQQSAAAAGAASSSSSSAGSQAARQSSEGGCGSKNTLQQQQQQQQQGRMTQPSQQQRRRQPAATMAELQPLMPPVAPTDPAAMFLHAAHQYTFPFSGAPVLKTASVVTQLEAAAVAQHTADPRHHWLPPTLTGNREDGPQYDDGLAALLPEAGWGGPKRGGWGGGRPAPRRNNMLSSSGYAVDGAVNTSGDPVVDLQQELQLPPQAVVNSQQAFAASFAAWGATLHASSLTAAGLRPDDISASQELLASPAVTRLSVTLALYVWMHYLLHTHQADAAIMRGACGHVATLQVGRGKRRGRRPTAKDTLEAWDLGWQMLKQIRAAAAAAAAAAAGSSQQSGGAAGGSRFMASSAGFMSSTAGGWDDGGASSAGALQQPSGLTAAAVSSLAGPSNGVRSRAGSIDGRSVAAPSERGRRKLNRMQSAASSASSGVWGPSSGGFLGGEEPGEGGVGAGAGAVAGRAMAPVVASTPEQQMAELLDLQECREAALLKAWHTLRDRLKKSQAGLTLCLPLLLLFLRSLLPGMLKQQYPSWYRSALGGEGLQQLDALILSILDPHGFFQQIPLMQGSKAALQMRHGLQWQQKLAGRSVSIAAAAARSGADDDDGASEWDAVCNQGVEDVLGSCKGAGGAGGQPRVSPIVTRAVGAAGSPKARQLLGAAACKAASRKPLLSTDGGAGATGSKPVTVAEKAQVELAQQAMSSMALNGARGGKTELCGRLRSELHNSRCFS